MKKLSAIFLSAGGGDSYVGFSIATGGVGCACDNSVFTAFVGKHIILLGCLPCEVAGASRFFGGCRLCLSLNMSRFGQLHTLKCISFLPRISRLKFQIIFIFSFLQAHQELSRFEVIGFLNNYDRTNLEMESKPFHTTSAS